MHANPGSLYDPPTMAGITVLVMKGGHDERVERGGEGGAKQCGAGGLKSGGNMFRIRGVTLYLARRAGHRRLRGGGLDGSTAAHISISQLRRLPVARSGYG